MRIVFPKNIVSITVNYECSCGHKFTRKNNDWFTISPFNNQTTQEMRVAITEKMNNLKRNCPKCKKIVSPKKKVINDKTK